MEDPGKLMEQGMQVEALKASVKEGKRLLAEAVRQRNLAKAEAVRQLEARSAERAALRWVRRCFAFRFLPKDLRSAIERMTVL